MNKENYLVFLVTFFAADKQLAQTSLREESHWIRDKLLLLVFTLCVCVCFLCQLIKLATIVYCYIDYRFQSGILMKMEFQNLRWFKICKLKQ